MSAPSGALPRGNGHAAVVGVHLGYNQSAPHRTPLFFLCVLSGHGTLSARATWQHAPHICSRAFNASTGVATSAGIRPPAGGKRTCGQVGRTLSRLAAPRITSNRTEVTTVRRATSFVNPSAENASQRQRVTNIEIHTHKSFAQKKTCARPKYHPGKAAGAP